jgi:hypothetical protein
VQWPEEEDLPGFKTTFLRYLKAVENLSNEFTELVAEALGLPSDGLAQFYGSRDRIQHRSKVRPSVGPHPIYYIHVLERYRRADLCLSFLDLDRQISDAR